MVQQPGRLASCKQQGLDGCAYSVKGVVRIGRKNECQRRVLSECVTVGFVAQEKHGWDSPGKSSRDRIVRCTWDRHSWNRTGRIHLKWGGVVWLAVFVSGAGGCV